MENNPLMSALVQGTNLENVVAKAEDIQTGGGLDFSKIFFEPQQNCDYLIKFYSLQVPAPSCRLVSRL